MEGLYVDVTENYYLITSVAGNACGIFIEVFCTLNLTQFISISLIYFVNNLHNYKNVLVV